MKKIIAIMIVSIIVLTGCSNIPKGDNCDFLVDAYWEGTDEQCTNVIDFKENNKFSNWCACGSPVGDGDLVEEFKYIKNDNCVKLYDENNELLDTAQILFCDDMYLVIDLWSNTYVYSNLNSYLPEFHESAKEIINPNGVTKPCLTILKYKEDKLIISSYDYDGDAKDGYTIWDLPTTKDVTFKSVAVTVENDVADMEVITLSKEEQKYIGEYYTSGYIEINGDGLVEEVIFYGETIVWNSTIE